MEIILLTTFLQLLCGALGKYDTSQTTGHGSLGQLYTALNTSGPIWLLKRSYNESDRGCVYTVKQSLNQTEYEFNQYYKNSSLYYKERLYATLAAATGTKGEATEGNQGAKLIVRKNKDDEGGIEYLLLHWDESTKCGILQFKDSQADTNQRAKCEAHQWNQTITDGQTACLNFYNQYCQAYENGEQTVYNENCTVQTGC
ncbi:uncharacterized protein LOC142584282 [Dermacentor variabilis]|uniref:uncharacterized protein LOC142584282 n=1 Tax=Dermacentor variabilis TaxID=34621 RepID=UPI003F5AF57D